MKNEIVAMAVYLFTGTLFQNAVRGDNRWGVLVVKERGSNSHSLYRSQHLQQKGSSLTS
jgi:hypothetical protein